MVVNNKTHLSGDKIQEVLVNAAKKNAFSRIIYILVIAVCGLAILVTGLVISNNSFTLMGGVFSAFSIVYLLFCFFSYNKNKKKILQENENLFNQGIDYSYIFKEQSIKILAIEPDKRVKKDYSYKDIKKVYEYDEFFELSFTDTLVAYVAKDGFDDDKMIEFFKKNLSINKKKLINKCKDKSE
ncbi:MAG: hypothetical protein K6E20_03830 [Acholeplasmatales bacterium]|nr:hypothetical protein [Acholeplasmatales bacterium]